MGRTETLFSQVTVPLVVLAVWSCAARAQIGGGPPLYEAPIATMLHAPVPNWTTRLITQDPEFHYNFDTAHLGSVFHDGQDGLGAGQDPSPLWGRYSPKLVYVAGSTSGSAYYYSVVPTGNHLVEHHQSRDVTLYKRHQDATTWEQVWTYEWSGSTNDGYAPTRRAFQAPSVVVTNTNGNQTERLLHVVFLGYNDVPDQAGKKYTLRHIQFEINSITGDLITQPPMDMSPPEGVDVRLVRSGATATPDNQFMYIGGPDFGSGSVESQLFKVWRYTPSDGTWVVPSIFANYVSPNLPDPGDDRPITLQYTTSAAYGNRLWMVSDRYDWQNKLRDGAQLIVTSGNGGVLDYDIVLAATGLDIFRKIDMEVVPGIGTGDYRIFIVVEADDGERTGLHLLVYDQTLSPTPQLQLKFSQAIPDASQGQISVGDYGNIYYDTTLNALYFLSRLNKGYGSGGFGRRLGLWRASSITNSAVDWDINARLVLEPPAIAGWNADWRRIIYVQTLTNKSGGDIPGDGIHALVMYEMLSWLSTYNDHMHDGDDEDDALTDYWNEKEGSWSAGPGKLSWPARGVWDIQLDGF